MPRVPMLAGSRLVVVTVDDDALALRPPPPPDGIADVRAAVRDALRFPLAGEPLEALVPRRGGRATIVVEPPSLPLPGTDRDPRQDAIAAAVDELERLGISSGYQTLLVAGGLPRRPGHAGVADRPRARARARRPRAADRCVSGAQSPARHWSGARIPVRRRGTGADRRLAVPTRVRPSSWQRPCDDPALAAAGALGRGRVRRSSLRCPRRSAHPRCGVARRHARRRARCDLHRRPADDTVASAGASESAARRTARPRARASSVAGRVSRPRRGDGDPAQPVPAALRASDAAAVPRVLRGGEERAGPRGARPRRAAGGRRARRRGLPRRAHGPPVAALRGLEQLCPGALIAGSGAG